MDGGRVGEALHLHCPFNHLTFSLKLQAVSSPDDRYHADVDVRSQTTVEADFFLAKVGALLQTAEIQEAEVHRLLHLVGIWAGEEHHRDMRLADFHRVDWIRE